MLSSLVCGNFQDQEDEELEFLRSWSSSKKQSKHLRRRHSFGTKRDSKNPYADRGLDKFSALLSELDSKRQKIYTQKGSEDISLLGFAYTNSSDYKPIVVRVRDKKPTKTQVKPPAAQNESQVAKTSDHDSKQSRSVKINHSDQNKAGLEKFKYHNKLLAMIKIESLRQPSYYVPVIIIFILLFLAIFGKSFAILCVSIGWYMIPTIKSESSKSKIKAKDDQKNKKAANFSTLDHETTPSSPTSVLTGHKSPPQHGSPLHPKTFL